MIKFFRLVADSKELSKIIHLSSLLTNDSCLLLTRNNHWLPLIKRSYDGFNVLFDLYGRMEMKPLTNGFKFCSQELQFSEFCYAEL